MDMDMDIFNGETNILFTKNKKKIVKVIIRL